MMDFIKEEALAAYGLVVVFGVLFAGAVIGQFFGGIGDKMFGKKEQPDPKKARIKD